MTTNPMIDSMPTLISSNSFWEFRHQICHEKNRRRDSGMEVLSQRCCAFCCNVCCWVFHCWVEHTVQGCIAKRIELLCLYLLLLCCFNTCASSTCPYLWKVLDLTFAQYKIPQEHDELTFFLYADLKNYLQPSLLSSSRCYYLGFSGK